MKEHLVCIIGMVLLGICLMLSAIVNYLTFYKVLLALSADSINSAEGFKSMTNFLVEMNEKETKKR